MQKIWQTKPASAIAPPPPSSGLTYGALYIYLNFILLLLARMLDSVSQFQLNLSQIFLGVFSLLFIPFFPFIYKGRLNKLNPMASMIILVVFFSPAFYLSLDLVDDSRLLVSHSALDKFISYTSYSVHALAIYVCISSLNKNIWDRINKFIFYIGYAISLEAIIFYFMFPGLISDELIAPKGKFVSMVIRDNVLCGIVATIFYIRSIILFKLSRSKSKFTLFINGVLAFILLLAAGERSTILAFFVLNLLTYFLMNKWVSSKWVFYPFLIILCLITLGAVLYGISTETHYFNTDSLIDRIAIASIGVKAAIHFFPFGAGGNMSSAYFGEIASSNNQLSEVPTFSSELYEQFLSAYSIRGVGRISWHNTYLTLVSDIGIVGIIIVLALVFIWLKYYFLLNNRLKKCKDNSKAMEPILWFSFYFFILISFLFTSQNSYYWVFGFYLYGSLLAVNRFERDLSLAEFQKVT